MATEEKKGKKEKDPQNPKVTHHKAPEAPAATSLPEDVDQNQLQVFIQALRMVKRPLTAAPTATPKNFLQQFEVYDTGGVRRLYVYVGATWRYVVLT